MLTLLILTPGVCLGSPMSWRRTRCGWRHCRAPSTTTSPRSTLTWAGTWASRRVARARGATRPSMARGRFSSYPDTLTPSARRVYSPVHYMGTNLLGYLNTCCPLSHRLVISPLSDRTKFIVSLQTDVDDGFRSTLKTHYYLIAWTRHLLSNKGQINDQSFVYKQKVTTPVFFLDSPAPTVRVTWKKCKLNVWVFFNSFVGNENVLFSWVL